MGSSSNSGMVCPLLRMCSKRSAKEKHVASISSCPKSGAGQKKSVGAGTRGKRAA